MKRILLFISVLIFAGASVIFAQTQVDIGVNFPAAIGITYQGESVSESIPFVIPIPDLMIRYNLINAGPLRIGLGMRGWTLIVISAAYPMVAGELEVGPVMLHANIGGGVFAYSVIGQDSGIESGQVFLPEVSAFFKFSEWFSAGAGILGLYIPELTTEGMGFTANVIVRFTFKE